MIQRPLRFGALFAGYGGLEDGVQSVIGGVLAWYSEYEPPSEKNPRPSQAAARIMAYHHPGVPNLGDITQIDWHKAAPVDVLTGGSPCQDVSTAGKRAGMRAGTRSGLWASMCDAIDILRPELVVWENVRGAHSSEADSSLEPCPGCVGGSGGRAVLRALGRVLGDLAELGYDAWWCGIRASDVGAPHGRYRVFVFATPQDPDRAASGKRRVTAPGQAQGRRAWPDVGRRSRTPPADADSDAVRVESVALAGSIGAPEPGWHGEAPADAECRGRDGRSRDTLGGEVGRAAPARSGAGRRRREVPPDSDGDGLARLGRVDTGERDPDGRGREDPTRDDAEPTAWGPYAPAIDRWAAALGRPAPPPTELGPKGAPRLSSRFVEWLMGLPAGHVTDVPGISRSDQLKALGNGVVPAQAAAATRRWLNHYADA